MYSRFFGFSEKPFNVTPDPRFLYLTQGHREMLEALFYGIKERRGFITIVGEVGTGKTTLINTVLSRLDEKTKVAYIFNTAVAYAQLLTMALVELGLAKSDDSLKKVEAVNRLNEFAIRQLAGGPNVVLIVDVFDRFAVGDDVSFKSPFFAKFFRKKIFAARNRLGHLELVDRRVLALEDRTPCQTGQQYQQCS